MIDKHSNLKQLAFWLKQKKALNPDYELADAIADIENGNVPYSFSGTSENNAESNTGDLQ